LSGASYSHPLVIEKHREPKARKGGEGILKGKSCCFPLRGESPKNKKSRPVAPPTKEPLPQVALSQKIPHKGERP